MSIIKKEWDSGWLLACHELRFSEYQLRNQDYCLPEPYFKLKDNTEHAIRKKRRVNESEAHIIDHDLQKVITHAMGEIQSNVYFDHEFVDQSSDLKDNGKSIGLKEFCELSSIVD
jgi:hypothetical protein